MKEKIEKKIDINITINHKSFSVASNTLIIDAAKKIDIVIPTLCHEKGEHYTSCFICVVYDEKRKKLVPACSTKLVDGDVITTENELIFQRRKDALNLLLSEHSGDCLPPCKDHCPARTDVQGYIHFMKEGKYFEATKLIKKKLALPLVCGTICPNPCEKHCRRSVIDSPINIRGIKRVAATLDLQSKENHFLPTVRSETNKKIAIIGGGPAGLACAYYSRQLGHHVEIFEEKELLGGMLRYGIPQFRLPWNELDAEINTVLELGVLVHYNQKWGRDFSLLDLEKKFDAIFLAIGAHASKPLEIKNENVDGVLGAVKFLSNVVEGKITKKMYQNKKIAVLGGGDVAMDAARVAKRLDANVTVIYRRTIEEMPALHHEREEAMEEGIEFKFLSAPLEIISKKINSSDKERATGIKVQKMQLTDPDAKGRCNVTPIANSEEILDFDLIIPAIGQQPDLSPLQNPNEIKLEITKWNTIKYDPKNLHITSKIFAGGDVTFGPDTAVQALAEGKRAAEQINLFFSSPNKITKKLKKYNISLGSIDTLKNNIDANYEFKRRFKEEQIKTQLRQTETKYSVNERLCSPNSSTNINTNNHPVNKMMSLEQIKAEANRCLNCGCNARHDCLLRFHASTYDANEKIYSGAKLIHTIDSRDPKISIDPNKCIKCGKCVNYCRNERKIDALSFVNRGFHTFISAQMNQPLFESKCDYCFKCVELCPTGALSTSFINYVC